MSVQAIGWVLDFSPTRGTDRLVLIALANHAGKSPVDGAWESYPGVDTIAREANVSRLRTVQEALARLEAEGHIQRIINGAPDLRIRPDRRPNLYRILIHQRGDGSRHPELSTGVTDGGTPQISRGAASRQNGVPHRDTNGVTDHGTQTVIKNRHRTPSGKNVPRADSPEPTVDNPQPITVARRALAEGRAAATAPRLDPTGDHTPPAPEQSDVVSLDELRRRRESR